MMVVSRQQTLIERVTLVIFAATSMTALAVAHAAWPAWGLAALCVATLFYQIGHLHARVAAGVRYLAGAVITAVVVLGLFLMAYPIMSMQTTHRLELYAGYSLAALTVLFLTGRSVWPAPSSLIPTGLGIFLVAFFNPSASLYLYLIMGGAALFAWLALPYAQRPRHDLPSASEARRLATLAAIGLATFLTAWGIIRLLPWAQAKVEQATFEHYLTGATHYSIFSTESNLGDIARLKLSDKLLMRVWSSRAQKLRGRVFTVFNGSNWRSESAGMVNPRKIPILPFPPGLGHNLGAWLESMPGNTFLMPGRSTDDAVAADAIRTKILQAGFNEGMVMIPGRTVLLRLRARSLGTDEAGQILPPLFTGSQAYGLVNRRRDDVIEPGVASPQLLEQCLRVPPDTDPRIQKLAADLAPGGATPDERIRRTLDYLAQSCQYSLEVGKFHSRQPVAEFLFEKKRGYCQYFASAAALLLRLEGVPARYVTGFNIEEGNRQGDHYVVREMDAHAWVDAYVAGRGWRELDPTPEAEYEALHAGLNGGWWANVQEWMGALAAQVSFRFSAMNWGITWDEIRSKGRRFFRWMWLENPLRSLLLLAAFLLIAQAIRRGRMSPRSRSDESISALSSGAIPPELRTLIRQVDRLWTERGMPRPSSVAPLEHLLRIPPGKLSPQLQEATDRIVSAFYRCCFGGQTVLPAEIQQLQSDFELARAS